MVEVAVAALVLPLITLERLTLGPFVIYTFTLLMGVGVLTGFFLAVRRGAECGMPRERVALFTLFMVLGAVIGARFGSILYEPEQVRQIFTDPAKVLLHFRGITSFGVYSGGFLGALLFFRLKCKSIAEGLKFLDIEGFALPFSSFLGRVGCALTHDHLGKPSEGWLAVAFPDGSRYDLGLLEAIFLLLLSGVFLLLKQQKHQAGFFFILYCCTYGPFRFLLNQFREAPPQYFGISVDQYGASLIIFVGFVTIYFSRTTNVRPSTSENIHGNPVRSLSKP